MRSPQPERAPYRRITVPLDGTRESEYALRWAADIARRTRCPVDLVHVVTLPSVPAVNAASVVAAHTTDEERATAAQRLTRLADEMTRRGLDAHGIVLDGSAPSALADHVRATQTDLVVITTHDRGRIEHLLFGSVSESLARHAEVPVLVVHATGQEPSFDVPVDVKRVLLPIDGSAFSEQMIPHAAAFASVMQAEVVVLGVLQPVLAVANVMIDTGPDPLVPLSHAPNGAEHDQPPAPELDQAARTIREVSGVTASTVVLSDGQPARAIVDYANHHDVDVIAMTTHGRGAFQRAVAGSVADAVLRHSRVPLLLYRPTGH